MVPLKVQLIDPKAIFSITKPVEFENIALAVFKFQSEHCAVYSSFVKMVRLKRRSP